MKLCQFRNINKLVLQHKQVRVTNWLMFSKNINIFLLFLDGVFFSFQNSPKNLEQSCKMDLGL